jgi:hypothetical protein
MKAQRILIGVLALALSLVLAVGLSQAEGPETPKSASGVERETSAAAAVSAEIPIQGRLTDASGSPINGTRTITFTLYTSSVGGTAVCQDVDPVEVVNGLFSARMGYCTASDINGQQLYLGIQVEGNPEMTPRQAILPVPYAWSLRPGAIISDTSTSAVLNVFNHGNGWGLDAYSKGDDAVHGRSDASNHAGVSGENTGGGIGVYGYSDTGVAIRATGTGIIQSTAKSYLWISGSGLVKDLSTDTTRWDMVYGAARIWRGTTAGGKYVYLPVTIPGVLYGQNVTVTKITVYYFCADGTKGYITQTKLVKHISADNTTVLTIIEDDTNRTSNTATSYSLNLTTNNVLSVDQGILGLRFYLSFADDTNWVQIGGVRLELEYQ